MITADAVFPIQAQVLAMFRGARLVKPIEDHCIEDIADRQALRLKSDQWGMTRAIIGEIEDANYPVPDPSEPPTFVAVEKLLGVPGEGGPTKWVGRRRGHGITFGGGKAQKNLAPICGFNELLEWRDGRWVVWGGGLMHQRWKDIPPTVSGLAEPAERGCLTQFGFILAQLIGEREYSNWVPKHAIYNPKAWTQKAMSTCLGPREYDWAPDLIPLGRFTSQGWVVLQPFRRQDRLDHLISHNVRFDSQWERVTADTYDPSDREIGSWLTKHTKPIQKDEPDKRVFKEISYEKCAFYLWSPQARAYFNKQAKKQQPTTRTHIMPCGSKEDGRKVEAEEWAENDDFVTTAALPETVTSMDWRANDQTEDPETHDIPDPQLQEAPAASVGRQWVRAEDVVVAQVMQLRRDKQLDTSLLTKSSIWRSITEIPWDAAEFVQPVYKQPVLNNNRGLPKKSLPKWHRNKVELSDDPSDFGSSKVFRAALKLKPTTVFTPAERPSDSDQQFWEGQLNTSIDDYKRAQEVFNFDNPDAYHDEGNPIWRQDAAGNLAGQNFTTQRRTTTSKGRKQQELDKEMKLQYVRRREARGDKSSKFALEKLVMRTYYGDTAAGIGKIVGKGRKAVQKIKERIGQKKPWPGSKAIEKMIDRGDRGWFIVVKLPYRPAYMYRLNIPETATAEQIDEAVNLGLVEEAARMWSDELERLGRNKMMNETSDFTAAAKIRMKEIHDRVHKAFKSGHVVGHFYCDGPGICQMCTPAAMSPPSAKVEGKKIVRTVIHTYGVAA